MADPSAVEGALVVAKVGATAFAVSKLGRSSARALERVFGPSVDEVGEFIQHVTHRKLERIRLTIDNADSKLTAFPPALEGSVAERVWECVFEASNSDEPWVQEYLGGILASSRHAADRDDRGARIALAVERLSKFQLRAHYAWYSLIREALAGVEPYSLFDRTQAARLRVFVPHRVTEAAMDVDSANSDDLVAHALFGLRQDHLVGLHASGDAVDLQAKGYSVSEGGIVLSPYNVGIELYMWAHGAGHLGNAAFFEPSVRLALTTDGNEVRFLPGACRVNVPDL